VPGGKGKVLPELDGKPILVRFQPELTAYQGKLLSRDSRGVPVHAGSFIRKRTITLERELIQKPAELQRILIHEIHHFIWARLGNPARRSFEDLLSAEKSKGELGWSAQLTKMDLTRRDRARRSLRWRVYACESFCDTAAWYYASSRIHAEWTLAPSFRARRAAWFREYFDGRIVSI
jgi:hypothetical protein